MRAAVPDLHYDNANNAFSNKIGTIHREEDFGADGFFRGIQHRI